MENRSFAEVTWWYLDLKKFFNDYLFTFSRRIYYLNKILIYFIKYLKYLNMIRCKLLNQQDL